jgi:tryptophanyl-tRNA synthetase
MSNEAVLQQVGGMRWGEFKPVLTDAMIEHLRPIQARYNEVISDQAYLDAVLSEGAQAAAQEAHATLDNVRKAMGFPEKLY